LDITAEKKKIRARMKKTRDEMDLLYYRKWSDAISESCMSLPEWESAYRIHIYVSSVNNEVDTLRLILTLLDRNREVIVPKCERGKPEFWNQRIKSLDELSVCDYGIMEPELIPENHVMPERLDLVIAPLLAFDRRGGRLGFGKGFYDRLLRNCGCKKIGLAYSFQEVGKVPMDKDDVYLDMIVTEKEVIRVDGDF
jgi:5-formyltetrahydrofolate cyclo-ligase